MAVAIGWNFSYLFELVSVSESATFFWARFGYLFISTVSVAIYVFVTRFSGLEKWSRPWHIVALMIVPVVTNVLIWHPTGIHLMWERYEIIPHGNFSANIIYKYGLWFLISNIFNYTLVFVSFLLLIVYTLNSSILHRKQTTWFLIGMCIPVIVSVTYIFRVIPNLTLDFTPVTFIMLGIALSMGIFRDSMFDLTPLLRENLLDHIDDGLVLIDLQSRVVDINPSAANIFQVDRYAVIGSPITSLLENWNSLCPEIDCDQVEHTLVFQQTVEKFHYDLKISSLRDQRGKRIAHILLMRDVTERIHLLEELQQLATHDSLTDLYNRRYFFQLANQVLSQTIRYQRDASVLIIDIDHFKRFNDDFGHATGDMVLRNFAHTCRETLRSSDILARYGGEEFVIFLPETAKENAVCVGDRLRSELAKSPVLTDLKERYITISVGIASYQPDMAEITLDILLDRADQALYQAKQAGRDQVTFWEEGSHNPLHTVK